MSDNLDYDLAVIGAQAAEAIAAAERRGAAAGYESAKFALDLVPAETMFAELATATAAAEQRGYDKARTDAAAMIRSQAADIVRRALAEAGVSISVAEEHPFVAAMELAARIVEATKETPDATTPSR